MKTATGLAAYAKAQLGKPYWWGTFGQTSTLQLLAAKRTQYPSQYTAADFKDQLGVKVHDCVGLIKGYLWCDTPYSEPVYRAEQDVAVAGLYSACTKAGEIASMPDVPGVCVFMQDLGHVGVYIGDGMVVEALGHAYGVVSSALGSRPWKMWGMPKWIDYGETPAPKKEETCTVELPVLLKNATGEAVKAAQILLLGRGYKLPKYGADGDFGNETLSAVKKFQIGRGRTANGKIDAGTWAALLGR